MNNIASRGIASIVLPVLVTIAVCPCIQGAGKAIFNVKDYGATGRKADDSRPAIQKAIDACAAAGGGTVYLPPGEYTSGTLHLRSHVSVEIEAGATLFASPDPKEYDFGKIPSKAALFYGEDVENISLGGRGTLDGQAEYEWREDDFERGFDHKELMRELGKPLLRSFPKGFPERQVFPHLVWLGRVKDVRITGLNMLHSPSWTVALYACERAVLRDLNIYTSRKEGVWADGIDVDGCKEVFISGCSIETGDDCLVFISSDNWGPPRLCENVTVSNCRLSSASAGVKFSEGNRVGVRRIIVSDTVMAPVNRGLVFLSMQGGFVEDVLVSNLTIQCARSDWFWAGDGQPFFFRILRETGTNQESAAAGQPTPGAIRDVTIRNVIARAKGSSLIQGLPDRRLERITLESVRLFVATDPAAPYDKAKHGLQCRWADNVTVRGLEVHWEKPALEQWRSALAFENVNGLVVDNFSGHAAWPDRDAPVIALNQVTDTLIRHSRARDGTRVFVRVMGQLSRGISLQGNDLRHARVPLLLDEDVEAGAVTISECMPAK